MTELKTSPEKLVDKIVEKKAELEASNKEVEELKSRELRQRMDGPRTIKLTMNSVQRPMVEFTGFWNGRFIAGALNAISRAYRLRRFKPTRPEVSGSKEGGE